MQWWKTLATWVYQRVVVCKKEPQDLDTHWYLSASVVQCLISNQPVGMVVRLLHLNLGGIEKQNQYEGWLVGVEEWTWGIIWVKSKSFKENFLGHALCWVDPSKQKRLFLCQVELFEEPSHFWLQSWMPICPFYLSYIESDIWSRSWVITTTECEIISREIVTIEYP